MMKQKNTPLYRLLQYGMVFIVPVLLLLSSCNEGGPQGSGAPTREFKMNCVMLSHDQVKSWVDKGWTKPGDSAIREILLQFYSPDIGGASNNMQLIAYPGRTATNVKKNGAELLAVDTTCKAVSFKGKVILANNEAVIEKLDILNPDGTLKEFDYLRFTPQTFKENSEYISFKVETVTKGVATAVQDPDTKPCPPWCNPDDD